jgi:hypothetical protein
MRKIVYILCLFIPYASFAQIPEDAVRYSWFTQNGTARSLAIGGAMGSLGGDITATFMNPAGIGFYRTNEATFSPNFLMDKTKTNYLKNDVKETKNTFGIGTTGFAIARPLREINQKNSNAFSIAFTQNANFNKTVAYSGLNNFSSFGEQFVEEFVKSRSTIQNVLNTNSILPYTSAPALDTYLIDTVRVGGNLIVKAAPEYILDMGQAIKQEVIKTTKGGLYELGFAYAGNDGDKFLWGVALGVPIMNYQSDVTFKESDTSSNTNNRFKSFTYNDNFKTTGIGFNAKLGIIYRPKEYIRIGLAVHTHSYMSLTDSRQVNLKTELENPIANFNSSSDLFTNGKRGEADYAQNMPWKVMLSGSYVFREVEDVTKQRGFISADIEYVKHSGSKFSSDAEEPTVEEKEYYKQLNGVIKDIYKGNINARIGGEVKFNTIMGRVGFGYYGNPYKDAPIRANKMTLSGGLGYRNKGFFVDVTYVHRITKDFDIPYRLQNTETLYAGIKQQTGNVIASIGVKF